MMQRLRNSILAVVALLAGLVAVVASAPPKKRNSIVILPVKSSAVERVVTQEPSVKIVNSAMIFKEINDYPSNRN